MLSLMLFCLFSTVFPTCADWSLRLPDLESECICIAYHNLCVYNLFSLQSTDTSAKDQDIIAAIVANVASRCGCDFGNGRLTDRVFQCFPSFPERVAYQAQLHGTLQANASQLAALLQDWASSVVTIPVQFLPLSVHNFCTASSSSPLMQQCPQQDATSPATATPATLPTTRPETDANTLSQPSNTPTISSNNQATVIIVVVVVICVTIIVIVIVVVILVIHRSSSSNKRLSFDLQNTKCVLQ